MVLMTNTTEYTVATALNFDMQSWRYTVSRAGRTLDTRFGYATRSEADGAAHAWLRNFLAVTLPEIKRLIAEAA